MTQMEQETKKLFTFANHPDFANYESIEYNAGMRYLINRLEFQIGIRPVPHGNYHALSLIRNTVVHNPSLLEPVDIRDFVNSELKNLQAQLPMNRKPLTYKIYSAIPYAGSAEEAFSNRSAKHCMGEVRGAAIKCYEDLEVYQGLFSSRGGRIPYPGPLKSEEKGAAEYVIACTNEICAQLISANQATRAIILLEKQLHLYRNKAVHCKELTEEQVSDAIVKILSIDIAAEKEVYEKGILSAPKSPLEDELSEGLESFAAKVTVDSPTPMEFAADRVFQPQTPSASGVGKYFVPRSHTQSWSPRFMPYTQQPFVRPPSAPMMRPYSPWGNDFMTVMAQPPFVSSPFSNPMSPDQRYGFESPYPLPHEQSYMLDPSEYFRQVPSVDMSYQSYASPGRSSPQSGMSSSSRRDSGLGREIDSPPPLVNSSRISSSSLSVAAATFKPSGSSESIPSPKPVAERFQKPIAERPSMEQILASRAQEKSPSFVNRIKAKENLDDKKDKSFNLLKE